MAARRTAGLVWAVALVCGAPTATAVPGHAMSASATHLRQLRLHAPGVVANDRYGVAVAASGRTLVVGAPGQGSGAVFVFTRPLHGWRAGVHPVKLTPPPTSATGARFGQSVAIKGATIVVGAPGQNVGSNTSQGATYVFTESHGGWHATSHPAATLTAKGGAAFDDLGGAVALSGSTIVAAASGRTIKGNELEGAAYVFTESRTGWKSGTQAATLTDSSGGVDDGFGCSVAVSGDVVVIGAFAHPGAGVADVFVEPKHGWRSMTQTRILQGDDTAPVDQFGFSVSAEGRTVVVGAPAHEIRGNENEGVADVFTEPRRGWGPKSSKVVHQVAELASDDGTSEDGLGSSVSLSGPTIVLGAIGHMIGANSRQGAAYGYKEPANGWRDATESFEVSAKDGEANDSFGSATAVEPGVVVVGAPDTPSDTGAAYVFAQPGPVLSKVRQSQRSWALGARKPESNPRHKPAGGTEFSFSVSESTTVSLSFSERKHGHYRQVHTIRLHVTRGRTKEYIDGKLGAGAALEPGRDEVTISATNSSGTTKSVTLKFTTH